MRHLDTRSSGSKVRRATATPNLMIAVVLTGFLLLTTGCGAEGEESPGGSAGDAATWELLDAQDVTADSESLDIGVTRLGCASSVTGEVLAPQVSYESEQIIIQLDVEPFTEDAADCPGNDVVPVTVDLEESVGERELVDGACSEGEEAAGTHPCQDEVRWP